MKYLFLFLFLISVTADIYGKQKGQLDLPDIFIWGKDRSELPGLTDKDFFQSPYLNKMNFLSPLELEFPRRTGPADQPYDVFSGLDIYGGWGSLDEYVFRATQEKLIRNDWFFGYDVSGDKRNIEEQKFDYTDVKGFFNIGKIYDNWNMNCSLQGISSDSLFDRNIWKADASALLEVKKISIRPGLFLEKARIDKGEGGYSSFNMKLRAPVFFNNWVIAYGDINRLEIQKKSKRWSEFNIRYLNTVFRDFSFGIDAGYRSSFGRSATFGGLVSGDVFNTGYSVFIRRINFDWDLFLLYNKYPFLKIDGIYKAENRNILGFNLTRNVKELFEAEFGMSYLEVKNRLILVNEPLGLIPYNIEDKVNILESTIKVSRKWIYISYSYNYSKTALPYFYSKAAMGVSPAIFITAQSPLKLELNLSYIPEHEFWKNKGGTQTEIAESFVNLNIEARYKINQFLGVRAGGENLLGQKILPDGDYIESRRKFYIIINLGFNEKINKEE